MTFLLTSVLYVSAAVFLAGTGRHMVKWFRAPAPLKIVLTPAPKTPPGMVRRLCAETFGFRSLFEADRVLWIQAWLFHVSLLLLLAGHVGGLVMPDFARQTLGLSEIDFHRVALVTGGAFGLLAMVSLLGLLIRRCQAERSRWVSTFSDYFVLTLLLLIVLTGNQMRFLDGFDLAQARRFVQGWLTFHPAAAPASAWFVAHVMLVSALLIYIPFSKMVHLCGATFFSPSFNQLNNPRESAAA